MGGPPFLMLISTEVEQANTESKLKKKGSLQNSWKKTMRFGAEKGFQTSLFAFKINV